MVWKVSWGHPFLESSRMWPTNRRHSIRAIRYFNSSSLFLVDIAQFLVKVQWQLLWATIKNRALHHQNASLGWFCLVNKHISGCSLYSSIVLILPEFLQVADCRAGTWIHISKLAIAITPQPHPSQLCYPFPSCQWWTLNDTSHSELLYFFFFWYLSFCHFYFSLW